MEELTLALFGEAERGAFERGHFCRSLPQLVDLFGQPPEESLGLHFAVQALLYEHQLIFFRVREEGFSEEDYIQGLRFLQNKQLIESVRAICIPGVGDNAIIDVVTPICLANDSIIITTEPDLYDYLTQSTTG